MAKPKRKAKPKRPPASPSRPVERLAPPVPLAPPAFPARFSLLSSLRGIPLRPEQEIEIRSDVEHALFLQCSEVFRIIDLLARSSGEMVDTYSKYRTRDPFRDALILRFFGVDETILSKVHPEIETRILGAFNRIHELRLRLSHVDALPFTVKEDLVAEVAQLTHAWDDLRTVLQSRLGWELAAVAEND
jgi:hypothetical protein